MEFERHADVLKGGEGGEQVMGLEDESESAADSNDLGGGGLVERLAEDPKFALLNATEGADQGEQGRFP